MFDYVTESFEQSQGPCLQKLAGPRDCRLLLIHDGVFDGSTHVSFDESLNIVMAHQTLPWPSN
jgi:hypothetical protein